MKHSCQCHGQLLRYMKAIFGLQLRTLEIVTKLEPPKMRLTPEQRKRFRELLKKLKRIDPDPTFPKKGRK